MAERGLVKLMQDVCEELDLPEEKGEHAPILEALNEAFNLGAASPPAPEQAPTEMAEYLVTAGRVLWPNEFDMELLLKTESMWEQRWRMARALASAYAKGLADAAELRLKVWADEVLDWYDDSEKGNHHEVILWPGGAFYCCLYGLTTYDGGDTYKDLEQDNHAGATRSTARLAAARAIAASPGYEGPKEPGT